MPEIGRWPKIDPKAELYFQITPYVYATNTPTKAIDPDGRLVIFINGQHGGTRRKVDYWQKRESVTRYSSYSFLAQAVWSGNETRTEVTQDFASEVQDHFNDHRPARFYDGALGGWANTAESFLVPQADNLSSVDRYARGKQQGEMDAADPGVPGAGLEPAQPFLAIPIFIGTCLLELTSDYNNAGFIRT